MKVCTVYWGQHWQVMLTLCMCWTRKYRCGFHWTTHKRTDTQPQGWGHLNTLNTSMNSPDRNINHNLYQRVHKHFQPVHNVIFPMRTCNSTTCYTPAANIKRMTGVGVRTQTFSSQSATTTILISFITYSCKHTMADHLILGLIFLWVKEYTYQLVGLVSFEVVSLCLYALIPVFLPLMKAPLEVTFCNNHHLSCCVGLHLFNVIESATFHCFFNCGNKKKSHGARSGE